MYYTQLLRVSRGLLCLSVVMAALFALIAITAAANGWFYSSHVPPHSADTEAPVPAFFAVAGFVAAIFGSRFARSLSEENEAHLPVVWTAPVSRLRYAATVMAIDAAGIFAAFAIVIATMFALMAFMNVLSYLTLTPDSWIQLARFLAFPLAFYGLMSAATASLGKPGRAAIGYCWVAVFLLGILNAAGLPRPWDAVIGALDLLNPIHYAAYSHGTGTNQVHVFSGMSPAMALSADVGALCTLCAVGLAAALWQWRRLEA